MALVNENVSLIDEMRKAGRASGIRKRSRVEEFKRRYDMFNDNYRYQVVQHLVDIYSKANEIRLDKQLDVTNNIYKTIVEKISRVYSFGTTREFSNDDMIEVYKRLSVDKYMKEANMFVNAYNDILLQVSWNYKTEEPRLIFRYPHKTKVILDEYEDPKEVEYFIEMIDDKYEKWAYWSDEEHYYKIYDGENHKVEFAEGNEEGVNPYGVLPFVFMQNGFRDGTFFDEYTGQDLISITLDNCIYNTFKNYLIKWQSFKQLTVTGSNIGELQGQVLDPSTALTASGDNVNIDVLDLQADLKQLDETIQSSANNVAINYNISPSQFRMSGQVSSGFALQMENASLDEYTMEQQQDFTHYEKQLFDLLLVVMETNGKPIASDFSIQFNSPRYKEAESSQIDVSIKRIDLGLISASEVIANERGITIDEAKAILDENLAERNKVYEKVNTGTELDFTSTADALGL